MARPEGFEPPTEEVEAPCSIQLSYGRALRRRLARIVRAWNLDHTAWMDIGTAKDTELGQPPAPVAAVSSVVVCREGVEASSVAAELVVEAEEVPLGLVVKARREATMAAQAATRSA